MSDLPTGTVTFLFTDIEGSTQLAQQYPDAMPTLLARHNFILQEAIESNHGKVFNIIGDAFCAAFPTPSDGMNAALMAQRTLQREQWTPAPIKVRMGLHTGEARIKVSDNPMEPYVGYLALTRVQRITSAAHGGQILLSSTSAELVRPDLPAGISLRDMGEHKLKNLDHAEHLWQVVATDLLQDFAPLQTLNTFPNNLPIQLTTFIGRETQLAEIKRLLETARLLTLTGVGGTGKTRLALQVAAELLEDFTDSAWLVQLAPLADPALVPNEVASALGIREVAGISFLDLLKEYLKNRSLLLVIDNCEHLIEACGQLADTLLHAAPYLKILATSREALGIAGETTFPVPSLLCPAPISGQTTSTSPEHISSYEAARLFVDRARAVQPTFQVTSQNMAAVAQICARLDGIPLALELAAARVRGLSAEQIAAHLDNRFRLLTGGSRTALPRQRTLQGAIDWSYNLLSEDERTLLRRLAVFSGGFTLDAAEVVCAGDALESHQILDLLLRLVDKSLVVADAQNGETRYHLLETIRQYAQEKLLGSGEGELVRNRHLDFFVGFAELADLKIKSAARPMWTNRVVLEYENLRVALECSVQKGGNSGLQLVCALHRFWQLRGYFSEGREWAQRTIAVNNYHRSELMACALITQGALTLWREDLSLAHKLLEEGMTLSQEIDYQRGLAEALQWLGVENSWSGEAELAAATLAKSVSVFRSTQDRWGLALALAWQGWEGAVRGDNSLAYGCFNESQALLETGDRWSIALPLHGLAHIAYREGNYVGACRYAEASLALMREANDTVGVAILTNRLGEIARTQGEFSKAAAWYEESLGSQIEGNLEKAAKNANLGFARLHLGQLEQARDSFETSLSLSYQIQNSVTIALALGGLAGVALAQERLERAARLLGAAVVLCESGHAQFEHADRLDFEWVMQTAREALGERFELTHAQGRSLTIEQVMAYAMKNPRTRF